MCQNEGFEDEILRGVRLNFISAEFLSAGVRFGSFSACN